MLWHTERMAVPMQFSYALSHSVVELNTIVSCILISMWGIEVLRVWFMNYDVLMYPYAFRLNVWNRLRASCVKTRGIYRIFIHANCNCTYDGYFVFVSHAIFYFLKLRKEKKNSRQNSWLCDDNYVEIFVVANVLIVCRCGEQSFCAFRKWNFPHATAPRRHFVAKTRKHSGIMMLNGNARESNGN